VTSYIKTVNVLQCKELQPAVRNTILTFTLLQSCKKTSTLCKIRYHYLRYY